MSSQQGSSRNPPNLQPKPIAISPIRHPLQNVVGRPLMSPLSPRGNLNQQGQQIMVGAVAGAIPLNVSQPRMTAQVLHQSPRMAMYAPGNPISQTVPKIVTGVPIYQNPLRLQSNAVPPGGAVVRMISSTGMQQAVNKTNNLVVSQSGQSQVVIRSPVGQFQRGQSSQIVAGRTLLPTSPALNQINQIKFQRANQIQGSSYGYAGVPAIQLKEISPSSSTGIPTGTNPSHTFRVASTTGTVTSSVTPSQAQVIAVTQIPTPKFFTGSTSTPFLTQQRGATPLSPLVPISPRMFQVGRPFGAQTQIFTPTSIGAVQPAVLAFGSQQCAIYSQGQSGLNQQTVLVNTSSPQIGTLPSTSSASKDGTNTNTEGAETPELPTDPEKPSPAIPSLSNDERPDEAAVSTVATAKGVDAATDNDEIEKKNDKSNDSVDEVEKKNDKSNDSVDEVEKKSDQSNDSVDEIDDEDNSDVNENLNQQGYCDESESVDDVEKVSKVNNAELDEEPVADKYESDESIMDSDIASASTDGDDVYNDDYVDDVRNDDESVGNDVDSVSNDNGKNHDDVVSNDGYADSCDVNYLNDDIDNNKVIDDEEQGDEDKDDRIVENFQDILNLRQNNDPDRYKKLEEKELSNDLDKSKLTSDDLEKTKEVVNGADSVPEELLVHDWDEEEFVWEKYLQDIGAKAVPPSAFRHVEASLTNGFVKGMKLEVPNKCDESTYWVATVLNTCGPLLRLRYDGYDEDSTGDFWCDLATAEIHSIGWCSQNGKNLQPPEQIKNKYEDWKNFLMSSLTGARTAPSYLLDKETGTTPIDQLKCGMRLEIQDSLNPLEVWLVQILENVGGRLFLRLEGTDSASKHFWMFYLNIRLHYIGWGKENECTYHPPKEIQEEHSPSEWDEILNTALKECEESTLPPDIFKDQAELKEQRFEVGMKLEALNPAGHNMVSPATVRRIINQKYFLIEMDDLRPKEQRESILVCCNSEYLSIFPVSWCQCKGIRLVPPPGWNRPDFLWSEYLSFCNSKAAPEKLFHSGTEDHEFERGLKLEAVNPAHPNQICAATITKIVGPLLWIHLDSTKDVPSHIEDIDSHNLFPIGWCESNGMELKPPRKSRFAKGRVHHFSAVSDNLNGEAYRSHTYSHVRSGTDGGSWCPELFINHRCFSGPYLSKGRIAELPRSVGPGPMGLVLKEVITLLVSVAYKTCRVLKELQLEGPPNPRMQQQFLKAKYKGKSYQAWVEVCRYDTQLEEFCRNICIKLECCPYLFSVLHVDDNCPENCQQLTKTKYNYNYGKKKKKTVGRPALSSNTDRLPKLGVKRGRKKKRFHLIHKKSHTQGPYIPKLLREKTSDDVFLSVEGKDDEGFVDDERIWSRDIRDITPSKKRKYTHHIPPPSDIQTRGAKLPKYSFERKTHKKILLSSTSPPLKPKPKLRPASVNTQQKMDGFYTGRILMPREESLRLDSNPLFWSVDKVVSFIKSTDCSHLARIIKEQEIDGQALLLLSLPVIQEHLDLKLGPAVKLCHLIERLKVSFYENYA